MNVSNEDEIMITILNRTEIHHSSFNIHHSSFYFPPPDFLNAIFSEARIRLRSALMTKQLSIYFKHKNILNFRVCNLLLSMLSIKEQILSLQ
jgi:hypothetical protein